MIDVSELMDDPDFARTFVVKRPTTTIAKDGTASTTYVEFETVGAVQPAEPADVQFLPEGTRLDDTVSVWSHQSLRGGDGKRFESDVLIVGADRYRVIRVEPRQENGYTRVFATGFTP